MKLAYLFSRYPVPSQTFCDTEMRALEDAGHEIVIYSCSPPLTSFRHEAAGRPRARVFYAPPSSVLARWEAEAQADGRWPADLIASHTERFGAQRDPAKRARHALYFAQLAEQQGIAHLHVHFANRATHAALFWHALTRRPFSFTAHAQDFMVDLGSDELLAEMCAQAKFVVAVSDYSRALLAEKCPDARARIYRIYNALSLQRWPAPLPVPTLDGTLKIFSAGRLIEFKGFDQLIDACAVLRDRGIRFQCEIAGEGPLRDALASMIAGYKLTGFVHLLGLQSQDEIRARLAWCDVFALACCTDEKGATDVLPTVILEALAAGRPTVSTRLAGIPEMIEDGVNGLLTEPGDATALAGSLARLAGDPAARAAMGNAARASFETRFTTETAAAELSQLFDANRQTVPAAKAALDFCCLCDQAPDSAFIAALPARWLILDSAKLSEGPVRDLEFLPDAIVLDAEWREDAAMAHSLEMWREFFGATVSTDDFLYAARRALDLRRQPLMRVHAIGPAAIRCAWLANQIGAVSALSFLLPAGSAWSPKEVRRVAPAFSRGGWIVGETKLAISLGPQFRGDAWEPTAWAAWLLAQLSA